MQAELLEKDIHFRFFEGGGEMGELTRTFHWASTSISAPQLWPHSLRSIVSTILHSRHPMFLWWGEDLIQFYNDAYRPSMGSNGKHPLALGQKGKDCWPEIWHTIKPLIDQVLAGGGATWSEDQLIPIFRNGKLEDVYWTFGYSPVFNDIGNIEGVLVVCNETTEKITNFDRLMESKQELSFAIDASDLGTWDLNPQTQKFVGNTRLKNWFGLGAQDVMELEHAIRAISPKERARVAAAIELALTYESGGNYDIEYTIINAKTNEERVVRAKGKSFFDENKIVRRFSGILQDITEKKKREDEMQNTTTRLELALDAGKLGSYEYIIASGAIHCNAQCKANFGLASHDTLTFEKFVSIVIPTDRETIQKTIERAIINQGIYNTEYRIAWPDGTFRWIRAYGKAVYDDTEAAVKMIGVTVDITEEKAFSDELETLVKERTTQLENKNKELERSNASLEEFTHIASHDLKEPMRKIHFFTDRLKTQLGGKILEDESLTFSRIENANVRMIGLIDDLLLYSRFSQRPLQMEEVDLNEKIRKVLEDLEVAIQQRNATVNISSLPIVKGYQVQLHQLFQNLIGNALKYHHEGLPPLISISSSVINGEDIGYPLVAGSYHLIEVTDNGIGFEQNQSERIFQMFQRLHGNAEYKGTGVGLAIARKVVDNHCGKVSARSEPGKGATFMVYLPA